MSSENKVLEGFVVPISYSLFLKKDRKNIYYYFRYKGKTYRGSTGVEYISSSKGHKKTLYEGSMFVDDLFHKIKSGKIRGRKKDIITFENIGNDFIKWKRGKVRSGKLSPKTMEEYERQVGFLVECFGKRDIEKFGNKNIYREYRRWRKNYYKDGKHNERQVYIRNGKRIQGRRLKRDVGDVSIDKEGQLLVSILNYGKEYMNVLQTKFIKSYERDSKTNNRDVLTQKEYLRLQEYWTEKNPYYWKIMRFINNTGLRFPSEVMNLKWKDIDLKNNRMTIRDRKRKGTQVIPLIGRGKEIIGSLRNRSDVPYGEKDYVWLNDKGKRVLYLNKGFKKSLVKCGIDKDITMYQFRHLFTTRMVKRPDISIKVISEILGHTDTTMVNRIYSRLSSGDLVKSLSISEKNRELIKKQQEEEKVKQMEKEMSKLDTNGEYVE